MLVSCALSRCIFCHLDLHALITTQGLALPNLIPHCLSALPLALKMTFIKKRSKPHLPSTYCSPAWYVIVICALFICIFCHLDVHALVPQLVLAWHKLIPLASQPFPLRPCIFIKSIHILKSSMACACLANDFLQGMIHSGLNANWLARVVCFCVGSCTRVITSPYLKHMHGSILVRVWRWCVMV